VNATAVTIFLILFVLVTVVGFYAANWRKADLTRLEEWGLAGRRLGTLLSWFLIGGDLYTAYTFIAVPALAFGAGALAFFAVPYTIIIYPFIFVVFPRFWSVAKAKGYITASDYVKGRFESRGMALAVAFTGILATMPYIALQLVGMQAVLQTLGFGGVGGAGQDIALIIAFAVVAFYTYTAGLRAPAMVAIVKDTLIYITIIAAVIVIPTALGGFGHIFHVANAKLAAAPIPHSVTLAPTLYAAYATLALGSALALFFYPHAITAMFATKSRQVIRRNAAFLPLYSLLLGVIALLGFMALTAGVNVHGDNNLAVPLLFEKEFPQWFVGFGFAAIFIGALVPAAIMSIASGSLFSRNIYKEYFAKNAPPESEAKVAKIVALVMTFLGLVFALAIPVQFSLYLQTLGGIWILQTIIMIVGGLYTRWFHRTALLIGWAVGMIVGTAMTASVGFASSFFNLGGVIGYAGIWALIANAIVVVVLTLVFNAAKMHNGTDQTTVPDYAFEEGPTEVTLG
jgi:SSS family solute:Na+ symporter